MVRETGELPLGCLLLGILILYTHRGLLGGQVWGIHSGYVHNVSHLCHHFLQSHCSPSSLHLHIHTAIPHRCICGKYKDQCSHHQSHNLQPLFPQGPLYPALQNLISKWVPPTEKGKFVSATMGGTFGTVITWPLIGMVIQSIGWVYGFYVPALLSALAAIFWWYIVTDTPQEHPRIKEAERKLIEDSFQGKVSSKKESTPYWEMLKSVPLWSLLILNYGSLWGMYFLLTSAPKFMNEVLGYNLTKSGFLAALPYLARMISGFVFGIIGDAVLRTGRLSVTWIRKIFCIFCEYSTLMVSCEGG